MVVTRNKTTKNAWNNATMTKIVTKWSDYRFKGGNHSVTKHYSNREPENLPEFFM